MIVHRYGTFTLDGRGHHTGALCYPFGGLVLPPPARSVDRVRASDDEEHNTYQTPMEDRYEDWLRLVGEGHILGHPEHGPTGIAHPRKATHTGHVAHPEHPHIRLGGSIDWDNEPHDLVKRHMEWIDAKSERDLIIYLCGPQVFEMGWTG